MAQSALVPSFRPVGRSAAFVEGGGGWPRVQAGSRVLQAADTAAVGAAVGMVLLATYAREQAASLAAFLGLRVSVRNVVLGAGLLALCRGVFWAFAVYQDRLNPTLRSLCWRVPCAVAAAALPVGFALGHRPRPALAAAGVFWAAASVLALLARGLAVAYAEGVRPRLRRSRTAVICGTGARARALAGELAAHPAYRYQLLGFVDSAPQAECAGLAPWLGATAALEGMLMRSAVDEVILALPMASRFAELEQVLEVCNRLGVQTRYSLDLTPRLARTEASRRVDLQGSHVVLDMAQHDNRLALKAAMDRVGAAVALVLLTPLLLAIALGIKLSDGGPVLFVQQRWGRNRRTFPMYKFRSMVVDAEAKLAALEAQNETGGPMFKMRRDPRVTAFGSFLRKTSLDELPQLLNVLRGEMSVVGPRPLPNRDVERFSEAWLMRRFSVRPGITGLWQVSGRSNTSFERAIELDLEYIDRWSVGLDARILVKTFAAVVRSRGAY